MSSNSSFIIDKIEPSNTAGHVDVHVRYDGGMVVLAFPESYPKGTLLAQVRLEIRARMQGESGKTRLASLLGRHDL